LAAATLGIEVLEVHVTLSREMFVPDVQASLTTAELRQLVEGVRFIERMKASPVDKDKVAVEMAPLRDLFTKSIVTRSALQTGTLLQDRHLALKKPGTGIPANKMQDLLNRRLKRSVPADYMLTEEDLD
jgi:N-acetylneuraminate synthase